MDLNIFILIVDGYETTRCIVKNLLWQGGFKHIDEAADGGVALRMMKQKKYDLVISDWNLRQVSGLEFLRKVRGEDGLRETPFVMITSEDSHDDVLAAIEAGVSNYVMKPLSADALTGKIAWALRKL